MPKLGAHMSIAGGYFQAFHRGQQVGCEAIQVFTKQPNRWAARPITEEEAAAFLKAQEETGIAPVIAHDAYLINLASPEEGLWKKSLDAFQVEIERADTLGIPYLVTHAGAHKGTGEEAGLQRIVEALDLVCERTPEAQVMILLETTAGQGTYLCYRFEHIAWLLDHARCPDRLGVCFDTCHAFAAGYDLRTPEAYAETMAQFKEIIGLEHLKAFHLNDCRKGLGSRVDRHAHIGEGELGLEAFRALVNDPRFQDHPMVLETPKGPEMEEDRMNLAVLRGLMG